MAGSTDNYHNGVRPWRPPPSRGPPELRGHLLVILARLLRILCCFLVRLRSSEPPGHSNRDHLKQENRGSNEGSARNDRPKPGKDQERINRRRPYRSGLDGKDVCLCGPAFHVPAMLTLFLKLRDNNVRRTGDGLVELPKKLGRRQRCAPSLGELEVRSEAYLLLLGGRSRGLLRSLGKVLLDPVVVFAHLFQSVNRSAWSAG